MIGMSQEKLGELLGITFQQIQKYEKGINRIGAGRLHDIARFLGVPVDYFYEDVGSQTSTAPGFSENEAPPPILEFMSHGEGLQLGLAFMRIRDPKVRKRVLDLIKSIADSEKDEKE